MCPSGVEVQVLSRAQMKIVDREYVESNKDEILGAIQGGKILIYPTDTIYGLGCNALLEELVGRIREIKHRETKPFSVIAPSKEWIIENCIVSQDIVDQYLPGPYTLILNKRSGGTLGVRIPKHWFTAIVEEAGVPFITTSVNLSGEPHMNKLEDVSQEILAKVDYVVYEGEKVGESSQKINLL